MDDCANQIRLFVGREWLGGIRPGLAFPSDGIKKRFNLNVVASLFGGARKRGFLRLEFESQIDSQRELVAEIDFQCVLSLTPME